MKHQYAKLFSDIKLGECEIKNRIVSTGHHTYLADREPSDELIAYHAARAKGGAGLIITEIVAVHESAAFSGQLLCIDDATNLQAYARLADAIHQNGCKLFAQLFHPGREILASKSGFQPIAYAPSAVPTERFHILPRTLPADLISEIIDGFGHSASMLAKAGFDGVEIVGNQGYLPAQFLSPATNLRDDDYGGDFERRLFFVRQCIASIRKYAPDMTIGIRLSADDYEPEGLNVAAVADICAALTDELDYFSLVAGSSATLGASVHIVAPMGVEPAYIASMSDEIRQRVNKPVIVTGRINQPQDAEQILQSGQADLCGMTRALICDAELPNKAMLEESDNIRACIACNQSCIGRAHKGLAISCLQNPVSGRELTLGTTKPAIGGKRIMIVGAGPAGMKAAVIAAERGFKVDLFEQSSHLGGQALLAQLLPGREEFGGLVTNLVHELSQTQVQIHRGVEVTADLVHKQNADHVLLATGGQCYTPELEFLDNPMAVRFDEVLLDTRRVGNRVIVADWRGDWTGLGVAEMLAKAGCHVSLYTNAAMTGETLQIYTRNHYVGRLYELGVEMVVHARLYAADSGSVFFQNSITNEPMIVDGIDTLVYAMGVRPAGSLANSLSQAGIDFTAIGDCLVPRSAEEAIYEGLTTAYEIS